MKPIEFVWAQVQHTAKDNATFKNAVVEECALLENSAVWGTMDLSTRLKELLL
jgi:hypothetical protein